ncbi:hypothetical protein BRADI_4g03928v3 [Brachypodium distachyon]|uniref:Uncharacterized protein n=1 Tax=Brachypodium distachyon TaxID=15368 RepID=A0A2K2CKB3_BRADI|nr:hypothetical protein BRADI_4g03928v3 [Brachypodium distachyon]
MASSSAVIKMAALLMLALFAGQLLMATPAAAVVPPLCLQISTDLVSCPIDKCDITCFTLCLKFCKYYATPVANGFFVSGDCNSICLTNCPKLY